MNKFFDYLISSQCDFSKEQLIEKWNQFNQMISNIPSNTVKKSGYQNFFAQKRIEYKAKNPSMPFTELSKIISTEWNKLNPNEKNKYINEIPIIPPNNYTFEELNQKKMSELKDLCEKIGIKKSGNKTELIKNLLGQNNTTISNDKKPIINIEKTDSSLDIYVTSKTEKRSDFETNDSNIDEDIEYEDNILDKFEDSDSEVTINDDSDLDAGNESENDVFV